MTQNRARLERFMRSSIIVALSLGLTTRCSSARDCDGPAGLCLKPPSGSGGVNSDAAVIAVGGLELKSGGQSGVVGEESGAGGRAATAGNGGALGVGGAPTGGGTEAAGGAGGGTANSCQEGTDGCVVDLTPEQLDALLNATCTGWAAQITLQPGLCEYFLPTPLGETVDPYMLNVVYTDRTGQGHLIVQNSSSQCTPGWQLRYGMITLCGDVCTLVQLDVVPMLEVVGGCATVVGPP
jgi:hypothetical protein